MFVISQKCAEDFRQTEMLGRVQVRVQHVKIYAIHELCRGISTRVLEYTERERKVESTTQRPTNLKRGRSERVSWGEAEEKSTVTVTLLQRRDKGQQL